MSWFDVGIGEDLAITAVKHLKKISIALEEIALGLNYLRRLENDEVSKEDLRERIERTWNKDWINEHGKFITKAIKEENSDKQIETEKEI